MTQEQMAQAAILFIQVGYRVLATRVLMFIALFAAIGLFAWAMNRETYTALAVAIAYSVIVVLPILHKLPKETLND